MTLVKYIFISMFSFMLYFLITDLQIGNSAEVIASDILMTMLITTFSVTATFAISYLIDVIKSKMNKHNDNNDDYHDNNKIK